MSKVSIINNVTIISLAAAKAIDSDGSIWNQMNAIFSDGKGNFSPFENALLYCQKEPAKVEGQIAELMANYTAACAKKNFDTLQDTLLDDAVEALIDYTEEAGMTLLQEEEVTLDLLFTYKEAPIEDVAAAIAAVLPDTIGKEQLPNASEGVVDPAAIAEEATEGGAENPTATAEGTDEGAGDDEEVQSNLPVTATATEGAVTNYGDINLNGLVEAVATVAATNQTVAKTNADQAATNAKQAEANALLASVLAKASGAPVNAEDITAEPVVVAG